MKKIYLTRLLKALALIVPLAAFFFLSQSFLFRYTDHNADRLQDFYKEDQNSLDVVVMGASEVSAGYSAAYAYGQFGYTSYPYSIDGNSGSLYLPQLKEILNYQDPQLLIVDVYGFLTMPGSSMVEEDRLRIFLDSTPLSRNKLETIASYPYSDKLSLLFPYIKYHGNLSNFKENLKAFSTHPSPWNREPSMLKGCTTNTTIYTGEGDAGFREDPKNFRISDEAKDYLLDFLDFCKEKELKVLFVNFPRCLAQEENHDLLSRVEMVGAIIEAQNFPFVDLHALKAEIGIEDLQDFYNPHHLNTFGQQKLTDYLGGFIVSQLGVVSRPQSAENTAHWQQCAAQIQLFYDFAREATENGQDLWLSEYCSEWRAYLRDHNPA